MTLLFGFDIRDFTATHALQVSQTCGKFQHVESTSEVKIHPAEKISAGGDALACVGDVLFLAARNEEFLADACLADLNFCELFKGITAILPTVPDWQLVAARLMYALRVDKQGVASIDSSQSLNDDLSQADHMTSPLVSLLTAVSHARNGKPEEVKKFFWKSVREFGGNQELCMSALLMCNVEDIQRLYALLFPSPKHKVDILCREGRENESFEPDTTPASELVLKTCDGEGPKFLEIKMAMEDALHQLKALDSDELKIMHESIFSIINLHFRARNYYECLFFLLAHVQSINTDLVRTLDADLLAIVSQQCASISLNILQSMRRIETERKQAWKPGTPLHNTYSPRLLTLARLACLLQPDARQSQELLCKAFRYSGDLENASNMALRLVTDDESSEMLILYLHCELEKGLYSKMLSHLNKISEVIQRKEVLNIFRAILNILLDDVSVGVTLIHEICAANELHARQTLSAILLDLKVNTVTVICDRLYSFALGLQEELQKEVIQEEMAKQSALWKLTFLSGLLCEIKTTAVEYICLRANVLQATGDFDKAQQTLVSAIVSHPSSQSPMICLANLRLKQGAYVAAVEDFQILLRLLGSTKLETELRQLPQHDRLEIARVHRVYAFRYLSKDRAYLEAIGCLSVAICAVGSKASGLILARAFCYMHTSDFVAASNDFNFILSKEKTLAVALCARAVLSAVTARVEEAICDFETAFQIDSKACQACLAKLPLEHVEVFVQLIAQIVDQTVELHCEAKRRNALTSSQRSEEQLQQGRLYAEFLVFLFPASLPMKCLHISVLLASESNERAFHEVKEALAQFPADSLLLAWHGIVLAKSAKHDEAISVLSAIRDCTQSKAFFTRFLRPAEIEQLFQQALQTAHQHRENGDYKQAIRLCNLALLFYPQRVGAMRLRMECYVSSGDSSRSMDDLNAIIHLEPTVKDLCLRALTKYSAKSMHDACMDYACAFELNNVEAVRYIVRDIGREEAILMLVAAAQNYHSVGDHHALSRLCALGLQLDKANKALRDLRQRSHKFNGRCLLQ